MNRPSHTPAPPVASSSAPPLSAFLAAEYHVQGPAGPVVLRIGQCFHGHGAGCAAGTPWALVTAWNPGSRECSAAGNRLAASRLAEAVAAGGWHHWPGFNQAPGGAHGEPSVLLFGIPLAQADAIAARFGQDALLAGELGSAVRLRMLRGRRTPGDMDTGFVDWVASPGSGTRLP